MSFFFFNDTATTEIYTLSLHDALPIFTVADVLAAQPVTTNLLKFMRASIKMIGVSNLQSFIEARINLSRDRKSGSAGMPRPISYAVFCLKKKPASIMYARWQRVSSPAMQS